MIYILTVWMLTHGQLNSITSHTQFKTQAECVKSAKGFIHELQPMNKTKSKFDYWCLSAGNE